MGEASREKHGDAGLWLTQNETPGGDEREWVLERGGTGLAKGRGEMSACSRRDRVEDGYACRWV